MKNMHSFIQSNRLVPKCQNSSPTQELSVHVKSGDVTCLIGTDSKLLDSYLRALIGVQDIQSGTLTLFDKDVLEIPEREQQFIRTKLAYVSKEAPLLSVLSVMNNIVMPALYHGTYSREDALKEAKAILHLLNFQENEHALPSVLEPIGRIQTAIARTLLIQPKVLALSDPWYKIPPHEYSLLSPFFDYWRGKGALITATQNLKFVRENATTIIFMNQSNHETFADWQSLCKSKNEFIQDYLSRHNESTTML